MLAVEKEGSDDVQDAGHLPKGFAPGIVPQLQAFVGGTSPRLEGWFAHVLDDFGHLMVPRSVGKYILAIILLAQDDTAGEFLHPCSADPPLSHSA